MDDVIFKQFKNEENTIFHLYAVFHISSLELTVIHKENAWNCTVTEDDIKKFGEEHKMENYFLNLKEYIKVTPDDTSLTFFDEEFTIFRNLENKFRVRFFFAKLQKVNYVDCVESMLNIFSSENLRISKKLNQVETHLAEIQQTKNLYEEKLQEFIEKKKIDDAEIYGKFLLVLNEKKQRIQHLTELLDAFKAGRPTSNPVFEGRKKKRKKEEIVTSKKNETISESDSGELSADGSNYNTTDDDDEEKEVQIKKANIKEPKQNQNDAILNSKPSTSKQSYSRFLEDSPPRDILVPRRIRSDKQESQKNASDNVKSPDSTSKIEKPSQLAEDEEKTNEESPVVEVNTQDLLDMF